jgi:hypothetical protein
MPPPPDPRALLDPKSAVRRVVAGLVSLTLLAALGVQAVFAFSAGRHRAEAANLLRPTDPAVAARLISRSLTPDPSARLPAGAGGELRFDPTGPLSVFRMYGLPQPPGDERYLIYVRDGGGSALAGAARPDRAGTAVVGFAGEPQPDAIYEVLVTRAVDDADSSPHGDPMLRWIDPEVRQFGVRPWVVTRR